MRKIAGAAFSAPQALASTCSSVQLKKRLKAASGLSATTSLGARRPITATPGWVNRVDLRRGRCQGCAMSLPLIAALAILAFAASFHLYWAFGGRLGYSVSLPQRADGNIVRGRQIGWWRPAAALVALLDRKSTR